MNPTLAEKIISELVEIYKNVTIKYLKNRTGYKKSIINSILHKNRHFVKTLRNPLGKNTKPIWSWSETEVELPEKIRVRRKLDFSADLE